MNLNSNRQIIRSVSANRSRPVILEVVSEADARGDLAGALDIRSALRKSCEMHLLRVGGDRAVAPLDDEVRYLRWEGSRPPTDLSSVFDDLQPDIVHTHRLQDFASIGVAAQEAGVSRLIHTIWSERLCSLNSFDNMIYLGY